MCILFYLKQKKITPGMEICFKGTVNIILSEIHEWYPERFVRSNMI